MIVAGDPLCLYFTTEGRWQIWIYKAPEKVPGGFVAMARKGGRLINLRQPQETPRLALEVARQTIAAADRADAEIAAELDVTPAERSERARIAMRAALLDRIRQ